LSRRQGWVLAHAFVLQLAAYIIRPASAYRALELGVSPGLVGLIAASFALVPLALAVLVGRWNDRGRQRLSLVLGGVFMVVPGVGLLSWGDSLGALLLWNAVVGLGHLMSVLAEQTLVARRGGGRLDSAFGTYTFVGTLGQAAAPALLAGIGGAAVLPDTRSLIWCFTGACVVLLLISGVLDAGERGRPGAASVPDQSLRGALTVPRATRRTMTGAMLVSTLVLSAIDLVQVYLPALGVERGISSGAVGVLLTLRATASMVSRLRLAWITDRVGRSRLVVGSTLVAAAGIGALTLDLPVGALGVALVVAGLALGVGQPLSMSIVALAAPAGTVSTWLALRLTGNRLGQAAIPAVVSVVAASAGAGTVFLVTAAGLLGTAALARVLFPADDV
jgi:MFS family permease